MPAIMWHQPTYPTYNELAAETGIPYRNLINLYLRECPQTGKKPTLSWVS